MKGVMSHRCAECGQIFYSLIGLYIHKHEPDDVKGKN